MTRARIVALTLIGLAFLSLGYLKVATADDPVSVPKGALGGDLLLDPCTYSTEDGNYAADCGTLVVPENRSDPQSRLIALPVTRIRARSERPGNPVFRLEGGPGKTNMKFSAASRMADDHDVVLVGYRGVDGSSVLDCPEVESALKHSTDLQGEKSFRAYGDALQSCADRLTDDGVDLAGYSLAQRVDDLEDARVGTRLRPHRPGERERRNAHGDDLLLALPGEHRPVGDDRGEPARPLPLGREDDRRADPSLRRALLRGQHLQRANRRPRRVDEGDRGRHTRPVVLSADQGGQRARRVLLRARGVDLGERPPLVTDDAGLMALGGRRRCERVLVPVAHGRYRLSHRIRLGRVLPPPRGPTPKRRATTSPPADRSAVRTSAMRQRRSAGAAAAWPMAGPPCRTRATSAVCGRRR